VSKNKEYYVGLSDRCWKLLPIFEGINTRKVKVFSDSEALQNFETNLNCLLIEVKGAVTNYGTNNYCEQIINLLTGLQQGEDRSHKTIKNVVRKTVNLCKRASEI